MFTSELVVIAILFMAALVRSTIGFGDALLAMPLLTLLIGVQEAAVLVAFLQLVTSSVIMAQSWRAADFSAAWRLVLAAAVGIPCGVYALRTLPEEPVVSVLGLLMVGFGLYSLFDARLPRLHHHGWGYLFGFVAGGLGGAYNTNGPPIVIYGACRGWTPTQFRATLHGFFLPAAILVIVGHGLGGLWREETFIRFAMVFGPLLVAVFVGGWLNRRIDATRFQRWVYLAILLLGGGLIGRGLW